MGQRTRIVALAAASILCGCKSKVVLPAPPLLAEPARPVDVPANARIDLARTGCRGRCPVYALTVKADGSVRYYGDAFVRVRSAQAKAVDPIEVRRLMRDIFESGFLSWNDSYETPATDLAAVQVAFTFGTAHKTIDDYGPDERDPQAPDSDVRAKLEALERRVDAVARSAEWVDCPGEDDRRCPE